MVHKVRFVSIQHLVATVIRVPKTCLALDTGGVHTTSSAVKRLFAVFEYNATHAGTASLGFSFFDFLQQRSRFARKAEVIQPLTELAVMDRLLIWIRHTLEDVENKLRNKGISSFSQHGKAAWKEYINYI
jgi:hypothetical protein